MSQPALVLDASVTLAWAFEDEGFTYTDLVLESLATVKACVPNIWPLEVGNALLVAERRGRLNQAASVQFLTLLWKLPILVESSKMELMMGEILALARQHRLSSYDAAYLHLAMRHGIPLATHDEVLRQAATQAGVSLFQ
jgi:predicted nucleic acid-binding protein